MQEIAGILRHRKTGEEEIVTMHYRSNGLVDVMTIPKKCVFWGIDKDTGERVRMCRRIPPRRLHLVGAHQVVRNPVLDRWEVRL